MSYTIDPELDDGKKLNGTYWRLYTAVYGEAPENGMPVIFEDILSDVEAELTRLRNARRAIEIGT